MNISKSRKQMTGGSEGEKGEKPKVSVSAKEKDEEAHLLLDAEE